MIDPNLIEIAELEIDRLIEVCHKQLNYWEILRILLNRCQKLQMLADAEYWLNQVRKVNLDG